MASDVLQLLLALEVTSIGGELIEGLAGQLEALVTSAEDLGGVQGTLAAVGETIAALGLGMVATGAALAAGIGGLAAVAGNFDAMLVQVRNNTTMTDADAQAMRETILSLGAQAPASLDSLAQGFMHITNFGFGAADATNILTVAMESALSTGGDVSATAETLAKVLHEFKIPATEAAQAMDMIHLAAAEGNMTLEQFTQSAGPMMAWAAGVGVPLDQVAAAFATMTRQGYDAAQSATQVQDIFVHLIKPSKGAEDALLALAKASGDDLTNALSATNLQSRGLTGLIEQLHNAMVDAGLSVTQQTAEWFKLVPNIRGGAAAFVLAGQGAGDFKQILNDLDTQTGITADAYERFTKTLPFQWGVLKNQIQETAQALGDALMPAVLSVVQALIPLVENIRAWIAAHADAIAQIVEGVTKFLLIAGAIMTVIGVITLLTAIVDPLILVLAAVAVVASDLAASWGVNWESIQEVASIVIAWVINAANDFAAFIVAMVNVVSGVLQDLGVTQANIFGAMQTTFQNVQTSLGNLSETFNTVLQSILDTVNSVGSAINTALSYLNPYAEHSPALVSQVKDGVEEIVAAYVSTGRIQAPLADNGAAIQQFAEMGKAALQSLADATKAHVDDLKGQLDELKSALAAAKSDLTYFSTAQIQGTQQFEDQKFSLQMQKDALQLQIDQGKLAGETTKQLKPLTDELTRLGLQASIVDLQEKLQFDPLKRQIQELAKPMHELPFDQIVAGIKAAQQNIAILTPAVAGAQSAYDKLNATLKDQNAALQEIAKNTRAGGGAAAFPKPDPIPAPVIQSVKDYNQAVIGGLHDIQTQHQMAMDAAQHDADTHALFAQKVIDNQKLIQANMTLFGQIIADVGNTFVTVRDTAVTAWGEVQSFISDTFGFLTPFIQSEVNQITNWWINNHALIQQTSVTVWTFIQNFINTVMTFIRGTIQSNLDNIQGIVATVLNLIRSLFQTNGDQTQSIVAFAWNALQIFIDTSIHDILDMLTIVMDLINGNWQGAWTTFQDIVSTAWTGIKGIFKDGIDAVETMLNALISAWDSLKFHIPSFSALGVSFPGLDASVGQIPQIPLLDTGGIVSGPTLALLAANSRPEAIVPLPRLEALLDHFEDRGGDRPMIIVNIIGTQLFGALSEADIATLGDRLARYINQQWAIYGRHA